MERHEQLVQRLVADEGGGRGEAADDEDRVEVLDLDRRKRPRGEQVRGDGRGVCKPQET